MTSNDSTECRKLSEFKEFLNVCCSSDAVGAVEVRSSMTRSSNSETYPLSTQEMRAEVLAIIWNHLTTKRCPPHFKLILMRAVFEEIEREPINVKACDIASTAAGDDDQEMLFDLIKLQKFALNNLEKLISRLRDNAEANNFRRLAMECKPCPDNNCNCCTKSSPTIKVPMHLVAAVKNKLRKMEDRHCCWPFYSDVYQIKSSNNRQYGFYGVFDGHGGPLAAAYAAAQLPQLLAEQLQQTHTNITTTTTTTQHIVEALKEAFIQTDKQFAKKRISSGTTAVCALHCRHIENNIVATSDADEVSAAQQLYLAWVGDSKAMLVSRSKRQQLVWPHKPDFPEERMRIESNNSGAVMFVQGQWRVNGILNVSRSIGDFSVSSVIAEPDVVCVDIKHDDDFLVLGTDGLWDHASDEDIASTIYDGLAQKDKDLDDLPKMLISLAKNGDSQDNITVVIVLLREAAKIVGRMSEKPFSVYTM